MRTEPKNDMADLIRAAFRKSGMSIKQLAERSGLAYSCVHGVIMGNRDPVLSSASRLCKPLGLELRRKRRKRKM